MVEKRLKIRQVQYSDLRIDFIGMKSLHGEASHPQIEPYEVRIRVVGLTEDIKSANLIGAEVETLLTNGPYGGAGDFKNVREIIGCLSLLLPREQVTTSIEVKELVKS